MEYHTLRKRFVFFICFLFFLLGGAIYLDSYRRNPSVYENEEEKVTDENWLNLSAKIRNELLNFQGTVGLVIKNLKNGKIIVHQADKLFPSASLVKMPIMAACFQAIWEGKIKLTDQYRLKSSYKARGSGILKYFAKGKKISIAELIELMITKSDNTAAHMLTDILGFEYLNCCFKKMGLVNTNLSRNVMDVRKYFQGIENFTTAWDIALLLEKMYQRNLVSQEASEEMLALLKRQEIRDRLPRYLPSGVEVAHKTGLFDNVCHDAGVVFHPKGDFIICVLVSDRRDHLSAKKLIGSIAKITFEHYDQFEKPVEPKPTLASVVSLPTKSNHTK